jgi:hypothetical protein
MKPYQVKAARATGTDRARRSLLLGALRTQARHESEKCPWALRKCRLRRANAIQEFLDLVPEVAANF